MSPRVINRLLVVAGTRKRKMTEPDGIIEVTQVKQTGEVRFLPLSQTKQKRISYLTNVIEWYETLDSKR